MLHWKPPGYYSMEVSVLLLTYGHSVTSFLCRLWHFKAKALTTRRANIVDGYYQVFVPSGNTFTSQILTVTGDIVFVCNFLGNAEISSLECSCWSLWHESKRLKPAILLCRCMPELIFVSGLHFLSSEGIHSSSAGLRFVIWIWFSMREAAASSGIKLNLSFESGTNSDRCLLFNEPVTFLLVENTNPAVLSVMLS